MLKRGNRGVRRLLAGLTAGVVGLAGVLLAASPAAAAQCGTGWRYGHWTTSTSYTYAPGGWCIVASDEADEYNDVLFQSDGNLVWYSGDHVFWASNTVNRGATRLAFQTDGNIVIYAGNTPLWSSGWSHNRNSSTEFWFQARLVSPFPNWVYDLSVTQSNPSATLMDIRRPYNG